ncbi:MAG: protease modulator HflK N-terminal domain-containing protein [Gammaproteobacteria bacterium]|nr:protease modulator HflK N-terminal domain-containing protein [Gammaproteobacteria bacterium]
MGWNEPGGQGPKDPWGNRGGRKNDGPPDLDEVVRNLQQRLGGLFGKRPPVGGGGAGAGNNPLLWLGIVILLVLWLLYDMFYVIDQQQRGVVLRFGEYQTTLQPGLSMRLPRPLERVIKVEYRPGQYRQSQGFHADAG